MQLLPLAPDNRRKCLDETGTGNTLDLSHPRVLQMLWIRFAIGDLVPRRRVSFRSRRDTGARISWFRSRRGILRCLAQDPVLTRVKLIAEPWDVGPGGYQLGHFPPGFAEWNDRFRDSTRRFWRGDAGERAEFASRFAGSSDLFDRHSADPGRPSITLPRMMASLCGTWSAFRLVTTRRTARTIRTAKGELFSQLGR